MRITQKMWQSSLLDSVGRSYQQMTSIDMRRRILTASDDPAGTEQLVRLRSLVANNELYQQNVHSTTRWLEYSESALATVTDGMRNAREIALTAADDANQLDGLVEELDSIIGQMMLAANSEYGGRYLFAGSSADRKPFELNGDSVIYHGDDNELSAAISSSLSLRYNTPGSEVFAPQEAQMLGGIDWDPEANWGSGLDQLFDDRGLDRGKFRITDGGGTSVVIDMRGSMTLADVRDRIEAALPDFSVSIIDGQRLEIRDTAHPDASIRIEDIQGGITATTLGISGSGQAGLILSRDLDPAMSDSTNLSELSGLNLPLGSIEIRLDGETQPTVIDLSSASTVGDIRAAINTNVSELNVEIASSGDRLRITGSNAMSFSISDPDGDSSASAMGIVGAVYPNRPIGVLIDLKSAIESGDRKGVHVLLEEISLVEDRIVGVRAEIGTRMGLAEDTLATLDSRNYMLTESISKVGDVDMAEALLMYQNAESVYQASLLLASNIYQMTLANYL